MVLSKVDIVNDDHDHDDMIISGDVDDSDVNYVDDIEDGNDGGYNEGDDDGEAEGYTTCKGPLLPTRYTVFTLLFFKASIACSQISVFWNLKSVLKMRLSARMRLLVFDNVIGLPVLRIPKESQRPPNLTSRKLIGDKRILATSRATLPCPRMTAASELRSGDNLRL